LLERLWGKYEPISGIECYEARLGASCEVIIQLRAGWWIVE